MVHVERNPPESLRNGRSRGPSPNGHAGGSPDSSDDDSTKNNKGSNKSTKAKSEYEEKIRVGKDYQTTCPELIPPNDRRLETLNDRALLVWSPTKDIPDSKLEEYITVAKEKYGYNGEQALGMLFWHKHDLERAVMDLANFTPFPDEWTDEDKVLFEQAFHFHGKSFHRIRQMLPDKNIASLVKYYYSWKKTRSRTSVMDRQEKNKIKEGSENGSENGSNEESDTEEKKWPLHRGIRRASGSPPPRTSDESSNSVSSSATKQANINANSGGNSSINSSTIMQTSGAGFTNGNANHKDASNAPNTTDSNALKGNCSSSANSASSGSASGLNSASAQYTKSSELNASVVDSSKSCFGCGVLCTQTVATPNGPLCNSCHHHWSRTGALRPTSGPGYGKRSRNNNGLERHKSKLPRGMYINHDDIVALACPENSSGPNNRNDDLLASMDREMSSLLSQIQNNKQIVSSLKRKNSENLDDLYPPENGPNRVVSRWNNDELALAVKGVRKYGKDFQAIAELLGTKSEAQVRTFFVNYRRKFNLDAILKEFESKQQKEEKESQVKTSSDDTASTTTNSTVATATAGAQSTETKSDANSKPTEDELMEIDLVDDIPTNKDDDDVEEVSIIENDQSLNYPTAKHSNGTAASASAAADTIAAQTTSQTKLDDRFSSRVKTPSELQVSTPSHPSQVPLNANSSTTTHQLQSSNGGTADATQTAPQHEQVQTASSTASINVSQTKATATVTSSTSAVLVPTVEPAKAAAV